MDQYADNKQLWQGLHNMTRRRSKPRLAKALSAVVVVGAGLNAAMRRRAARRARDEFPSRLEADTHGLEPSSVVPEDGRSAAPDSGENIAAAPGRRLRGPTTTNVLEALATGGAMTAAEVALATGVGRATISSTLSRLARTGEVIKAERGYQLPDPGLTARPTSKKRSPKRTQPRSKATATPSKATSARTRKRAAGGPVIENTSARTAPGTGKAKVLAALSTEGGLTAGEVATATGLARATVSTTLSRLAKSGDVVKADRGYRLPG